jgi:F420-non-reducing hydrogenase large subunit
MSIKKAAQNIIKKGVTVDQGILNMIEMAFRAYDPCFSCATHSLPGEMKIIVNFRDSKGNLMRSVKR